MKVRVYPFFIAVVVAGTGLGIANLEIEKSKLRRQIAQLNRQTAEGTRLRVEGARQQALIDRFKTSREEGAKAVHADLVAARAELTALEAKAARLPTAVPATALIDANRDPTKGMTRPEFLSEGGRATPEAAFQTLVWAAMKGRDPEMAACVSLDPAAQAKAEEFLATLSPEARSKYGTPEQLVGLVFSHGVLESTAFQCVNRTLTDADHVTLTVRVRMNGREKDTRIPMVRSGEGWAMAVGEKQIDVIRRGLADPPPK